LWNLGIKGASDEMIEALNSNSHITLLKNQSLVKQTLNYMALVRISSKYKDSSYNNYQISVPEKEPKIFKEKKKFAKQLLKVFNNRFSPAIVPTNELMVAPASYFIVCGTDGLKDEQLIYAERLKSVQRPVEIAYYKNAFHGIAPLVDSKWGFDVARAMLNDLVKYIEKNV
jgi:acetyl esterase/lipase